MKTIDPKSEKTSVIQSYILGAVAPRPIAFVSTIDKNGNPNLSPFSFFNAFSAKPPVVIFSAARRIRDNTLKHTLENVYETMEVVVNMVNYEIVQQTSLSSTEYPKGVSEFTKSGLTPVPSQIVKPFRVKESPVQFECKVIKVMELGSEKGAGILVICEILLIHINENILDEKNLIDPHKINLVARMGENWYCHAQGDALFQVEKPLTTMGIGVDQLPKAIRNSDVLTGNHLGKLGNTEKLPDQEEVIKFRQEKIIDELFVKYADDEKSLIYFLHTLAKNFLDKGKTDEAWKVLLQK